MRPIGLCLCVAFLAVCGTRAATACPGGPLVRGGYGMVLYGTSAMGQPEALAGAIVSDGKCAFSGHFYGNVNGIAVTDVAATGTYAINASDIGTLTLNVTGLPALNFAINWVVRHRQVTGLETDGASVAQIDAREQQQTSYSLGSLNASYSYLCSGTQNQPMLLLSVQYNGAGAATYSGLEYVADGIGEVPVSQTTYAVNSDGTYTVPVVDASNNALLLGGDIDSLEFNVPAAVVTQNHTASITGPLHCVGQKQ